MIWQWRTDYGVEVLTCRGTSSSQCSKVLHPSTSPDSQTQTQSPPAGRRSVPVTFRPAWTGIYGVDCRRVRCISPEQRVFTLQDQLYPVPTSTRQPNSRSFLYRRVFNGKRSLFPRDSSSQIQPLLSFNRPGVLTLLPAPITQFLGRCLAMNHESIATTAAIPIVIPGLVVFSSDLMPFSRGSMCYFGFRGIKHDSRPPSGMYLDWLVYGVEGFLSPQALIG